MSAQVTERIWNGLVRVRVCFRDTEYLLEAKRMLYFPLYFSRIIDYFRIATGTPQLCAQPVWLEYENVPLKWNWPIGLLYDLLYLPGPATRREQPWCLELRVVSPDSPYPSNHIIPFESRTDNSVDFTALLHQVFINALKQSCYVLNGSSRSVLSLSANDTSTLWRAVANLDMSTYGKIRRKLAVPGINTRHRLPIKIYVAGSAAFIQAPVWSRSPASFNTLGEVIREQVPGLSAQPYRVYIHGVNADVLLDEPIVKLWAALRFMDNFLYVVLALPS